MTAAMSAASSLVTILFMTTVSFVGGRVALLARKAFENHHLAEPLLDRLCWRSAPARARRHVAMDDADCCDLCSLADRDIVIQSNTRAEHNKILKSRTA